MLNVENLDRASRAGSGEVVLREGVQDYTGIVEQCERPSPALALVVMSFRFSNPLTSTLGVRVFTVKPRLTDTATAEATRTTREVLRGDESIATNVVKAS